MKFRGKKILGLLLFVLAFSTQTVFAQDIPVNAYLFYGDGCPHCAEERQYLFHVLKNEYPNLQIYEYEIYNSRENVVLLQKTAKKLNVGVDGVPFLIIGDKHFIGYTNGISSQMIEQRVRECSSQQCPDSIASIVGIEIPEAVQQTTTINNQIDNAEEIVDIKPEPQNIQEPINQEIKKIVKLPLLGVS